jgi:hypothetical protein
LNILQFVLILLVASIPVAMPAVFSITMALGALALSKEKAIVSRLAAIEEMAGVDILCSDKTGTLTKNQLTLGEPILLAAKSAQEIILAGALASQADGRDAIDDAVIAALKDHNALAAYRRTNFVPFDPVSKRTQATVADAQGTTFTVAKGAPQAIVALAQPSPDVANSGDVPAVGRRWTPAAVHHPHGQVVFPAALSGAAAGRSYRPHADFGSGFGWLVPSIPWSLIGWIWLYDLAWLVVLAAVRLATETALAGQTARWARTRQVVNEPLR